MNRVTCYSGHQYAERPKSFIWQGQEFEVHAILREWREVSNRCFEVETTNEKVFLLKYDFEKDHWNISNIL